MSTENSSTKRTHSTPDHSRSQTGTESTVQHRGLMRALFLTEFLTLASSWVALWLTVEVVPKNIGITEMNPVADTVLAWSTTGLGLFVLCALVTSLTLLRVAGTIIHTRRSALLLSACAGAVAGVSIIDAGWNVLLLTEAGMTNIVGAPGPAAAVFGVGSVLYLCGVHWLFRRRSARSADPAR